MTIETGGEAAEVENSNEAADEAAVSSQETEIEAKAREQGWVPKDEWKGKPDNWKPAATYVEHGDLKSRLAKAEDTLSRVGKTTEKAIEALKQQHERDLAELRAGKKEAVKKGDVAAVEAYDAAIEKAKDSAPGNEGIVEEDINVAFQKRNPWYGEDLDLTALAIQESKALDQAYGLKHKKGMPVEEMLAAVERRVKASPEYRAKYSTKTAANGHAAVDGGGESPAPRKAGKSASDLPSEVRVIAQQLVKDGAFKDLDAYAKEYWKNA